MTRHKLCKALAVLAILILISVVLETFLFNMRYWRSLSYEPPLDARMTLGEGLTKNEDGGYTVTNLGEAYIQLENIDAHVYNLYIDAERTDTWDSVVAFRPYADDEANALLFELAPIDVLYEVPRTQYAFFNLSGKTQTLLLYLGDFMQDAHIYLNEIKINEPMPLLFSWARMSVVFFVLAAAYALRPSGWLFAQNYDPRRRRGQAAILTILTLLYMVCGWRLTRLNENNLYDLPAHHAQYQQLAEAMAEGRLSLLEEPYDDLKEMDNPYDPNLRTRDGVSFQWDTAYYEGRYFVYFGVLPELLLYLPMYLLTGEHMENWMATAIMTLLLVTGLTALLHRVVRRYFPSTPLALVLVLQPAFIAAVGALTMAADASLYVVPVVTGLVFAAWGLFFWFSADRGSGCALSCPMLAAGSLCMSLVAACRPQILLGGLVALPLFWHRLRQIRVRDAISFFVPIIAVATGVMAYNAARFGSPFDFGATYNLTTNDMTRRGFHWDRIGTGLFYYLLQPSIWQGVFPYLTATGVQTAYRGITISEGMYGGVFASVPIVWPAFGLRAVRSELKERRLYAMCWLFIALSVVIAVLDTQMAGVLSRYVYDFMLYLLLASMLVVMAMMERKRASIWGRRVYIAVAILCALTVAYYLLRLFIPGDRALNESMPVLYQQVKTLVDWMS